jgi:hypothetical protein
MFILNTSIKQLSPGFGKDAARESHGPQGSMHKAGPGRLYLSAIIYTYECRLRFDLYRWQFNNIFF